MPSVGEILVTVVRSRNIKSISNDLYGTEISCQDNMKINYEHSFADKAFMQPQPGISLFYRPESNIPSVSIFEHTANVKESFHSHDLWDTSNAANYTSVNPYSSYIPSNQWSYYDRTSLPQRLEILLSENHTDSITEPSIGAISNPGFSLDFTARVQSLLGLSIEYLESITINALRLHTTWSDSIPAIDSYSSANGVGDGSQYNINSPIVETIQRGFNGEVPSLLLNGMECKPAVPWSYYSSVARAHIGDNKKRYVSVSSTNMNTHDTNSSPSDSKSNVHNASPEAIGTSSPSSSNASILPTLSLGPYALDRFDEGKEEHLSSPRPHEPWSYYARTASAVRFNRPLS